MIFSISFLMLKNKINIRGLLQEKSGNQINSPERVQILILTVIFVAVYLLEVIHNLNQCQVLEVPCSLPEIRTEYLFILSGSNFVYLWGKLSSIQRERL
jgi:hypothetical protein